MATVPTRQLRGGPGHPHLDGVLNSASDPERCTGPLLWRLALWIELAEGLLCQAVMIGVLEPGLAAAADREHRWRWLGRCSQGLAQQFNHQLAQLLATLISRGLELAGQGVINLQSEFLQGG